MQNEHSSNVFAANKLLPCGVKRIARHPLYRLLCYGSIPVLEVCP